MKYNSRLYIGSLLVVVGLLACVLGGCRKSYDSYLVSIDSKMEAHPDSALMLLNDYRLTSATSPADSAYYGLLLTHARYKNFIDETNDNLISKSIDYFARNNDKERASRALFLQGMIQMNANRLGEAAVSFTKGQDLARESKSYIWEGQCARGLCRVSGNLHDGSAQINYAKQAYEAFLKSGLNDWIDNAKYEMAIAYHNQCKFEECTKLLAELENSDRCERDTIMYSQVLQLKGLSMFFMGDYKGSLNSYENAYKLNPLVITDNDRKIIKTALRKVKRDSPEIEDKSFRQLDLIATTAIDADVELATRGNYKEAYDILVKYKNAQDSILIAIYSNNVSESIAFYEREKIHQEREKQHDERMVYLIVILSLFIVGIAFVWWCRERIMRTERLRLRAEADLEAFRCDLSSQINGEIKGDVENEQSIQPKEKETFDQVIKQQYAETNRLIDEYYQRESMNDEKSQFMAKIRKLAEDFKERSNVEKIIEYVDEKSGGLYSLFKRDFYDLSYENQLLFLYLMLGFGSRTISVILGQSINVVYNKKSRLKAKISKSRLPGTDRYLEFF